jgi:hypothetical protein
MILNCRSNSLLSKFPNLIFPDVVIDKALIYGFLSSAVQ